jgi:hypothetical protein
LIQPLLISLLLTLNAMNAPLQDPPETGKSAEFIEVDPARSLGKPVPSMELIDLDGKKVDLSKTSDEILVLEFSLPSCRFAQRLYIQKRVQPLIRRWGKSGVKWVSIDSSFFAHPQRWRDWSAKYSLDHQFLLDQEGQFAEALGVKVSPTYIVIHQGKIAYHGSLDDDIWGQNLERVVLLDNALKAIQSDEEVVKAYNKPYGMAIRTRRVEATRRQEFEEARKKALEKLDKPEKPGTGPDPKD